jgi:hypothetical protein
VQVDVRLDEVVLQALEKEPELRYQQASQVKTAVETIVKSEGRGPKAEEPGLGPDGEALEREILARDYTLDIGSCLRRGWALVRSDFWPLVGVTALVLVLWWAAGSIGDLGSKASSTEYAAWVLGWLLSAPLMGGLYFHFLKKIRGGRVRLETAFSGFSNSFLHLVLAGLVMDVLTMLGVVCLILPGIYLFVAWFFALPLIIDKRLDFWPAMRLSRKTISKHWWTFLGFLIALGLFNLAGILACCVGFFVTVPVSLAALMYAYEDIFNPPGLPSASTDGGGVASAEQPLSFRSWVTVVLAGLLVVCLLGVATKALCAGTLSGFCVAVAAGALTLALLLRVRRSALPAGFLATFLLVFLLVFTVTTLITSNKPIILILGALLGLALGIAAGVARVALRARRKRR